MGALLRLATAGSVDDGKSTLIGRLLYEAKQVFEDHLDAVERSSRERGFDHINLALLTDGLRAERDQGITIDVAYRSFTTPRRRMIIADTPGHVQYTRNMATGASTADVVLVLVDARKGMTEQSRRHAAIASLLQVKHLVVAVNKMDIVDFDEEVFERICADFTAFAAKLEFVDLTFVPISALHGDNVTQRSDRTPWYGGPTLLWHLENLYIASDRNLIDPRFPVQYVIRPGSDTWHDYRGYAGQVAGGAFRPGDDVLVLPSGFTTTVAAVECSGRALDEAVPPMSVVLRLTDELDISRGDMICRAHNAPTVSQDVDAMVCWFSDRPLTERTSFVVKHTTRTARCLVRTIGYRLNVNTLHRDEESGRLAMNDIGRVTLRTAQPLLFDPYRRNRATGSFILIDERTDETAGAGMILGEAGPVTA